MNGIVYAIMAAVLWGFVPILDKLGISEGMSIYTATLIRSIGAVIVMSLVLAASGEFKAQELNARSVSLLFAAGAIAGGIAMIVYFTAIQKIGVSKTIPVTSVYPLFTVIFSAMLLKESFNFQNVILGTLLIVAGLILIQR
ncbi:EamA family transporter [Geoglobus acetivorans]|uniref:EamA domain-containing protein n=1 Tax=Geoglobus acetivorans TaxID=565033 RepID=A0A0A7GGK2_GEOAI|nr:hypothetical protein GACE_1028 [Geoglobus acetivorans]